MKRIDEQRFQELLVNYSTGRRLRTSLRYNLEAIKWQEREFVALTNKQGNEGVFLSEVPGAEVVGFELRKRGANQMGRIEAIICDICATWQAGPRSATLTFKKPGGTATFLVCADLACCEHVRDETESAAASRSQLREHISIEGRIERLQSNLTRILT